MTATNLPGGSVFLVEDEVMIRMMVADMLEELGYSVAAEAGDINEAIKLAAVCQVRHCDPRRQRQRQGDFAGRRSDRIAQLASFIFATGYGAQGLPEEFRDRPTLQKPFQMETLAQGAVNDAQGRRGLGEPTRLFRNSQPSALVSASENTSSVRSRRSGVTET